MNSIDVGTFTMDSREDLVLTFEMAAWVDAIDSAGTPELRRVSDGQNYAAGLRGSPAVDGTLIAQEVTRPEKGERYWLILPFTTNDETFAPRLQITVPTL